MIILVQDVKQVKSLFDLLASSALPGESRPICQRGERVGGVRDKCLRTSGCKSVRFCSMDDISARAASLPKEPFTNLNTMKLGVNPLVTTLLSCFCLSIRPFSVNRAEVAVYHFTDFTDSFGFCFIYAYGTKSQHTLSQGTESWLVYYYYCLYYKHIINDDDDYYYYKPP